MWALLDETNIVINYLVGISYEEALEFCIDGNYLIEMTLENTPAYIGSFYDGNKFTHPNTIF